MNINDVWNGLTSIYNQVTPAVILIISAIVSILISSPKILIRNSLNLSLKKIVKSESVKNLVNAFELLKLSSLIPLIIITALLIALITIGDIASWVAAVAPKPLNTSIQFSELFSELRTPDELAILANHLMKVNEKDSSVKSEYPWLSQIESHFLRESARLRNKYPERYATATSGATSQKQRIEIYYGGFLALSLFFLFQLVFRKIRPKWLWFSKTTLSKTFLVFLLLSIVTIHYRLEWEWLREYQLKSEVQVTVDLLIEEDSSLKPSDELISWISEKQTESTYSQFWFARVYDKITMELWNTSHRRLR